MPECDLNIRVTSEFIKPVPDPSKLCLQKDVSGFWWLYAPRKTIATQTIAWAATGCRSVSVMRAIKPTAPVLVDRLVKYGFAKGPAELFVDVLQQHVKSMMREVLIKNGHLKRRN